MKNKNTIDCPFMDKRVKWLPCQKERCFMLHTQGVNISQLSKIFKVSRRSIMFELFPERREKSREGSYIPKNSTGGMKKYRDRLKDIKKGYQ